MSVRYLLSARVSLEARHSEVYFRNSWRLRACVRVCAVIDTVRQIHRHYTRDLGTHRQEWFPRVLRWFYTYLARALASSPAAAAHIQ